MFAACLGFEDLGSSPPRPSQSDGRTHQRRNSSLTKIIGFVNSVSRRPNGPRLKSWSSPRDLRETPSRPRSSSLDPDTIRLPKRPSPTYDSARDSGPPQSRLKAFKMDARRSLNPAAAAHVGRKKQVREAQEMAKAVEERAKRTGEAPPPYNFLELIGKGSFGRVFKSSKREKGQDGPLIALKIVDVDDSDYKLNADAKDHTIKDFLNEIHVLQTLKDSRAKNINIIHEAFSFHSQLWIVSDYCPGGSVHTLMKACNPPGLENKFIITISRELATALKYVHENNIIHRDVKAANILIRQDGQLQLCDFGVSGILENKMGKRETIIGTPYWMPPEMHDQIPPPQGYGTEIDIWSFGITVYELAEGRPPNSTIAPGRLGLFLNKAPTLDKDKYASDLVDFVSFCLTLEPSERPSADDILASSYVANTDRKYPTGILRELIDRYAQWEQLGGERISLFHASGAQGPSALSHLDDDNDYWNFDTLHETFDNVYERTARVSSLMEQSSKPRQAHFEIVQQEQRALRGGRKMGRLFDTTAQPYEYNSYVDSYEESDLPFRKFGGYGNVRESVINLDIDIDAISRDVNLDSPPITLRDRKYDFSTDFDGDAEDEDSDWRPQQNLTKRMTKDWKFPTLTAPATEMPRPRTQEWTMAKATAEYQNQSADEAERNPSRLAPPPRPMLKHMTTEPIGTVGDFVHPNAEDATPSINAGDRTSMMDLDAGFAMDEMDFSTAASSDVASSFTDGSNVNPFDLDNEQSQLTIRQRASYHTHSQSEPNPDRTSQYADQHEFEDIASIHFRGSSMDESHSLEGAMTLVRAPSVKDSMASLHNLADDEDGFSLDFRSSAHLNGESQFPFNRTSSTWSQHATQQDRVARQNQPIFRRRNHVPPEDPFRPISSTVRDWRSQRRGRSPGGAGPGTSPLTKARAPPVLKPFPTISAALPDALEDDAEREVVATEVQRLLEEYLEALSFTGDLLQKTERKGNQLERSYTYS